MARSITDVLREIIGSQTMEIARLQAEVERLQEALAAPQPEPKES